MTHLKWARTLIVPDRWEEGIDNHDESEILVRLISAVDFIHYDDSFCMKMGGDGDNGETLAYILDDLIDSGVVEIKINLDKLTSNATAEEGEK